MTRLLIQNADGSMSSLERDPAGSLSEAAPAWGPDPAGADPDAESRKRPSP